MVDPRRQRLDDDAEAPSNRRRESHIVERIRPARAGVGPRRHFREIRLKDASDRQPGDTVNAGDGVKLSLLVMGVLRQIAALGADIRLRVTMAQSSGGGSFVVRLRGDLRGAMVLGIQHAGAIAYHCDVADLLHAECLSLPCSVGLSAPDQERVIDTILRARA